MPSFLEACFKYVIAPFAYSKAQTNDYLAAERLFSPPDLQQIKNAYSKLSENGTTPFSQDKFQELLGWKVLDPWLVHQLFTAVKDPDQQDISLEALIMAMAMCLKGSVEEAADFTRLVLLSSEMGVEQTTDLTRGIEACAQWSCQGATSPSFAEAVVSGMAHYRKSGEDMYSRKHFWQWAKSIPAVVQTIQALMRGSGGLLAAESVNQKEQVTAVRRPQVLFTSTVTHTPSLEDCLLTPDWMWLLASGLPAPQTEVWELLFNSRLHGGSFSTFMGKAAERGPTLTLIRDKKGHLFGGYAADAWSKHGVFYGSSLSFIFGLLPSTVKFTATGANANMMWCGQGFSQIPNGVGWGGQVGYYGLLIDSSFEKGMSRPSATFSNSCLAADEVFEVDTIECWLLQQPEEEEPGVSSNLSILDRFKEDRHLMDLAGRSTQASAGVREARPEDDL